MTSRVMVPTLLATRPPSSLATTLQSLLADVPAALLDDLGREHLLAAAGPLPGELNRRSVGLELRLRGPARGDLFVAAHPTRVDGALLLDALRCGAVPGGAAAARLADTVSAWRDGTGWPARSCTFLLLELDASRGDAGAALPPSVYLAPRGADNANTGTPRLANAFHADPDGLVAALAALTGHEPDPAAAGELRALLELLPPYAEVFAAGAMLSRPTSPAPRIAVRRLRTDDVRHILAGLGRPAAQVLVPVVSELEPASRNLCLALDLGPHASPAVGVEVYAGSYWSVGDAGGWRPLLDRLVSLDLADSGRADAVALLAHPAGPREPAVGLSHVKVTATVDGLLPTKVYVGYEGAHLLTAGTSGARTSEVGT